MEKIVEFNNIKKSGSTSQCQTCRAQNMISLKNIISFSQSLKAPTYTCSLQDQLARNFTDKTQTIHYGAPP